MGWKLEAVSIPASDVDRAKTFYAEKGEGAWLNDSRLRVSGRSRLTDCIFGTGIPFGAKKTLPAMLQDLARLMPECAGVRRLGSAALDLAYVAAGRQDGYWEHGTKIWDIAAGVLLVREAGGRVGRLEGDEALFAEGTVVAGSPEIYDKLRATLLEVTPEP